MDLKKNNPLNCSMCFVNHTQWTVLSIFILPHISDFLAIFTYTPPNPGLNHRQMFSAQLSWPTILNHSHIVYAFPWMKPQIVLMSLAHFSSLRNTNIAFRSTLKPRMWMTPLEICFFSPCGSPILSHSYRAFVCPIGMTHWWGSYQLTLLTKLTENTLLT